MQTRNGLLSRKSAPKTAEEQQQIVRDAKLAARIASMPRSPTKKANKRAEENKFLLLKTPEPRSKKPVPTKRPVIANVKEQGDIDMVSPRGASAAEDHWQVISSSQPSESEEEMVEDIDLANVAEQTGKTVKRLRSLFKERIKEKGSQVAALEEELKQELIQPKDNNMIMDNNVQLSIAQQVPAHLRQVFSASVVNSIRAQRGQGDGSLTKEMVDGVMGTMRDLLRKPPREKPTPGDGSQQDQDDEEAKQKKINSIITRALAFIRNGQQKEALRELAKEELKDISDGRTTQEVLDLTAKLFPKAKEDELLPKRPEDAPRVLIAPDLAFRSWLSKAVRKIKASGPDGISTQAFRALTMEDEAVAFIASMVERIVNADIGKEELESLSTLLLVLIPKADGGAT